MKTIMLMIGTALSVLVSGSGTNSYAGVESGVVIVRKINNGTFKVYGKCGMCKKRIEKAANEVDGVNFANWDVKSKEFTAQYDASKVSEKEIQEKIAGVGHDTESVKATDEAYNNLPGCCKYDRPDDNHNNALTENRAGAGMNKMMDESSAMQSDISPMMVTYLEIKDALVADDPEAAKKAAGDMIKMPDVSNAMEKNLEGIAGSEDLKKQRKFFSELSEQMYHLAKEGGGDKSIYWNRCPMAMNSEGANWLSINKKISNPYMGQKMPGCGSVKEILNN